MEILWLYVQCQTKQQAEPHASGFSINIDTASGWLNTAHIHGQIRAVFSEKVRVTTISHHKWCTPSSGRFHYYHVKALNQQLRQYGIDPFASCHARDITTGVEFPKNLIKGSIAAYIIGNKAYDVFVEEVLIEGKKFFFDPIKKIQLPTGLKSKKAKSKALSVV